MFMTMYMIMFMIMMKSFDLVQGKMVLNNRQRFLKLIIWTTTGQNIEK